MTRRPISTPRQLGAAIYDARTTAGMTQAALAARAGVSRKWLIGLEQGSRTGAELAKILDVLHALGLAIQFSEAPQIERSSPEGDGTPDAESRPMDETGCKADSRSTSNIAALDAVKNMRTNLSGNTAALNAIRDMQVHFTGNTAALNAVKNMRTNLSGNTAALNAIRRATSQFSPSEAASNADQEASGKTSHEDGPELGNQGDKG